MPDRSVTSGGIADLEAKAQFLRFFIEQKDGKDLVINDFAHHFGHAPQRGIQVERGIDHIRDFEQKRFDAGT